MLKSTILFLSIFSMLSAFAQADRLDSLVNEMERQSDEERILLLHDIVKASWTTNPSAAVKYGRESIDLSKEIGDMKLLSASYRIFGGLYNYMSQIDSGRVYKNLALQIALELQDSILIASSYNNLGVSAQTVGGYTEALTNYYGSYMIGKQIKNFAGLPVIMANISEVYYDLGEYDSAVLFALKALHITSKNTESSRHLLCLNALARSRLAQMEYDDAKDLYLSIIEISSLLEEKRYAAYANQGLGRLYSFLDKKASRMYFSKALNLFAELDDKAYLAELYTDIASLKITDEPDSALYFLRKSLRLAKTLRLNDLLKTNYQSLLKLFVDKAVNDSIESYLKSYQELLTEQERESNFLNIEGVFAKSKDERMRIQLSNQSRELEKKTIQNNFFIAFTLLGTLFSVLIYSSYRRQRNLRYTLQKRNGEISNQNELIDDKNKKLQALNLEKNDLIGVVAHDLKNPLSNMISSVKLIKDMGLQAEDRAVALDGIEKSATRLSAMVTKVLDIDAIEKGLSNIQLVSVDLSEIISAICDDLDHQAQAKSIDVHRNISPGVLAYGDHTFIYQVAENIVSNAIKYSPEKKRIFITLKSYDQKAKLEVRDEGPGLSKSDLKQLFQTYRKLSAVPTANEHSSGLGLSIAKKYMDAMNGRIWCKSEPGQGASFYIQLDLVEVNR